MKMTKAEKEQQAQWDRQNQERKARYAEAEAKLREKYPLIVDLDFRFPAPEDGEPVVRQYDADFVRAVVMEYVRVLRGMMATAATSGATTGATTTAGGGVARPRRREARAVVARVAPNPGEPHRGLCHGGQAPQRRRGRCGPACPRSCVALGAGRSSRK